MTLSVRQASFTVILFLVCTGAALALGVQEDSQHDAKAWLEFNHHVGGMVVLVLAGLTWLEVLKSQLAAVTRLLWPFCLILLGLYNVIFSDKFAWPIGPPRLVESLSNPEVLQHKVLAIIVLALGLVELLRRLGHVTHTAWLYAFYGLAFLAGGVLLWHDFGTTSQPHDHRFTASHVLMGLLALLALMLKVLVDHRIISGRSAYLYPLLLVGLGMQLLLFTESSGMAR